MFDYDAQIRSHAALMAGDHMHTAVERIDKMFGEGYARKHPELVAAFMQAAAIDAAGTMISKAIEAIDFDVSGIENAIENLEGSVSPPAVVDLGEREND